jgi:hypothetical protein
MMTLPVLTTGTSYVTANAKAVLQMTRASIQTIRSNREELVRRQLKVCMEEKEPIGFSLFNLYFRFAQRPKYSSVKDAMENSEEIHYAASNGWGDLMVCEKLEALATWLIEESGYPESQQVIHLSCNDFQSIKK